MIFLTLLIIILLCNQVIEGYDSRSINYRSSRHIRPITNRYGGDVVPSFINQGFYSCAAGTHLMPPDTREWYTDLPKASKWKKWCMSNIEPHRDVILDINNYIPP